MTGAADPPARPAVRNLGRKLVIATVAAALVFAAISLYGDVTALADNLQRFEWPMFALAILLASGNYVIRFVRWHYYLGVVDVRVPRTESLLVFLSGFVMSVTPGKVGEVFKSVLLYESRGCSIATTAPIVVAERLTDLTALVLLTALGCLSFEGGVTFAVAGAVVTGAALVVCAWHPVGTWFLDLGARMPAVGRFVPRLREAYEALHLLTRPGALAFGSAIATVAWALEVGSLAAVLAGFGVELPWAATTFVYAASTIAGALAMMPGGLGVTEAGMIGLLHALGGEAMSPAVASATTILTRLATLWWAVVVGLVALTWYRRWRARYLDGKTG